MKATDQPVEWGAAAMIVGFGVMLLLYATVFRKYTENTKENRDTALKVIKKVVFKSLGHLGD